MHKTIRKFKVARMRVYNFHRDNGKDILLHFCTNAIYSFSANAVVKLVSIQHDIGVFMAQGIYYSLLGILFSRAAYETTYGKVLFVLSMWFGGYMGYLYAQGLVNLII
jgi:hypothetical protein